MHAVFARGSISHTATGVRPTTREQEAAIPRQGEVPFDFLRLADAHTKQGLESPLVESNQYASTLGASTTQLAVQLA